jgi:hypothetical protein
MKKRHTSLLLLAGLFCIIQPYRLNAQCTNCQHSISSSEKVSSAIGLRTVANGFAAFASGSHTIANGDNSGSLGSRSEASGDFSFTIGSNAYCNADRSMIIGHGYGEDIQDRLVNTNENSLMIGFNSIYPTLFVSPANSRNRTGNVGIGNVITPQAKLHIRADQGEFPKLFIEQPDFRSADILLGNTGHGIRSTDDHGLLFRTEKNYVFHEGNVGIGTYSPDFDLDVRGSTFTKELTIYDREHAQGNIEGWVLRSDAEGRARWSDPADLDDHDWTVRENNVFRLEGNVGIGTANPVAQLDLADIFPPGGMNLRVGNDAYLTDIDIGHTLGIFSTSDPQAGAVKLGNSGPVLFGTETKLGIGTRNPASTLELFRNLNTGGTVGLCVSNSETNKWFIGMNGDQKNQNDLLIGNLAVLNQGYANLITIKPNGNVGIGTGETYSYKLAVDGAILTEEVTVKVSENWPDYVFDKNYELPALPRLEEYIRENGHLPGIPSAQEVMMNGLKTGEMHISLLRKIEELTLYIIEQEARINKIEELFTAR